MTKKEKIALLSITIYTTITVIGKGVVNNVYGISYDQLEIVSIMIYFIPFALASALFFYFKYFKGSSFNRLKVNAWFVEFSVFGLGALFFQLFYGNYTDKNIGFIFQIIIFTLMVGIGEEILMRGVVLNALKERHGLYVAIIISSLIFGLLHMTNVFAGRSLSKAFTQSVTAFLVGIVLAWVFIKTNNIIPNIIYHWLWNMVGFLENYVHVSQTRDIMLFQIIFVLTAGMIIVISIIINRIKGRKNPI